MRGLLLAICPFLTAIHNGAPVLPFIKLINGFCAFAGWMAIPAAQINKAATNALLNFATTARLT
jgi:hypothetical protein